jgi:hypothetical protein
VTHGGPNANCIVGERRGAIKPRLLRASEVAWLAGTCLAALIDLRRNCGLPAPRIVNGEPMWLESDVLRWRSAREIGGAA